MSEQTTTTNSAALTEPYADQVPALPAPIQEQPQRAIVALGERGFRPTDLDGVVRLSKYILASGFAPRGMERVESIVVAIGMGLEIGLSPMQALQSVAVVNGRPAVFGDAALALVRASGLLTSYTEEWVGDAPKPGAKPAEWPSSYGCRVTVGRKGEEPHSETFTVEDARSAGLWGKAGPWSQYPKRMLMWRSRTFALRTGFGDVLRGVAIAEEVRDLPASEYTVGPPKEPAGDALAMPTNGGGGKRAEPAPARDPLADLPLAGARA